MATAEDLKQYLLELVNAERETKGLGPLALNKLLSNAIENHNSWMIKTNTFSHRGAGGSDPTSRIRGAGYVLTGDWRTGENIAWVNFRLPAGFKDEVDQIHKNFMNSKVHRDNILEPAFREIGLDIQAPGSYQNYKAVLVGQAFGLSGPSYFLTGVVYVDRIGDGLYSPGEGVPQVGIVARDSKGRETKAVTTSTGGYKLPLMAGEYRVTFSGNGVENTKDIVIAKQNLKLDLVSVSPNVPAPEPKEEAHLEIESMLISSGYQARRPPRKQ